MKLSRAWALPAKNPELLIAIIITQPLFAS